MSPCSPNDVSITLPEGPSGPAIPGFGQPFAVKKTEISNFPDGFPEDLLDILDKLQLLVPPGTLKPALNPNFGKDIFDGIMKLMDMFYPFLMMYKFFLPLLNLVICIIEVLCAIPNPFKLIRAMRRLFRNCIPEFLNLFPMFALIIMIISLMILLLSLVEYLAAQVEKFVKAITRNIAALNNAFKYGDQNAVSAIAKKLGALLCVFQNLFVLLSIFNVIIEVIKDILKIGFSIPPCDDTVSSDADGCCTTDVCPAIVRTDYTRNTGILQYYNAVYSVNEIPGLPSGLPSNYSSLTIPVRQESWQIYDPNQEIAQKFINIVDGYDVTVFPKPVFFPMDSSYNQYTTPKQAAYTMDLRLFYNPKPWGRDGYARYIKFNNCIVLTAPINTLSTYNNSLISEPTGTIILGGGSGFEDDGITLLTGFAIDGVTPIGTQATLNNFLHIPDQISSNPILFSTDGYFFSDMQYTFKPNLETLLNKNLVTLGCEPTLALNRTFINSAFAGDVGLKIQLLGDLVNGRNGNAFPDTNAAQQCLSSALSALRSNLTMSGVAEFQAMTTVCLQKLTDDANSALQTLIGLGFEACKSDFTVLPNIQFTTKPIKISVNLKEKNGISLTTGIPANIADGLAVRIKPYITFGEISNFSYDGYQSFTANLSSNIPGKGQIMIAFDNNIFCTNTIPTDNTISPTHDLQSINYQFIYTPVSGITSGSDDNTSNDGQARRDASDLSSDGSVKGGI